MSFPSKLALLLLLAFPLEAQVVCTGTPQITISGQTFNGTATSLVGTTDACSVGVSETANSVCNVSNAVVAEGTAADGFETTIGFGNATADATLTLTSVATGVDATGFGIVSAAGATTCPDTANAVCLGSNAVVAEGSTANAFETTLGFGNASADATLTLTGTATGVDLSGVGNVTLTTSGAIVTAAATQVFAVYGAATNAISLGTNGLVFGAALNSADVRIARSSSGTLVIDNSIGTAPGAILSKVAVETVAITKSPTVLESAELYTNGADTDGQAFTLPNDPTVGTCYEFALTATNASGSLNIVPSAGETLQDAATTCATNLNATAKGATARICAVSGGAGGLWLVMSKNGTWTCS